jgi:ferritin
MITIKIKENSKQAKLFVEYAKTLSFVEIQEITSENKKIKNSSPKSAIEISLEEEKKGKVNQYKNSDELFNKVLNV